MTYASDKPTKQCPYCMKEVRQLATHIINNHPTIISKLEENEPSNIQVPQQSVPNATQQMNVPNSSPVRFAPDIHQVVRQNLETMMNLKMLKYLEADVPLENIQKMMVPPEQKTQGLEQLKEFLQMQKLINPTAPAVLAQEEPESFNWGGLINAALPVIMQLIQSRTNNNMESVNNGFNTGEFKEASNGLLKPISSEVAGNTTEPSNFSEKSADNVATIEPIDVSDERISKWIK